MYQAYFSEDRRIFRDSVQRFMEKEIKPHIEGCIRHKLVDMATKLEAYKAFNKEIVSKMM